MRDLGAESGTEVDISGVVPTYYLLEILVDSFPDASWNIQGDSPRPSVNFGIYSGKNIKVIAVS